MRQNAYTGQSLTVNGLDGDDYFVVSGSSSSFDGLSIYGGDGNDTITLSHSMSGVTLDGGDGDDVFNVYAGSSVTINGGAGTNIINVSGDSVISGLYVINGTGGTTTLNFSGSSVSANFVTSDDATSGFKLTDVTSINGTSTGDIFIFDSTDNLKSMTIDGSGGTDSLAFTGNKLTLTIGDEGEITYSGDAKFTATNIEHLIGTASGDSFSLADPAYIKSMTIDGSGGTDSLAFTGNKLTLTIGDEGEITYSGDAKFTATNIEHLIGTASGDSFSVASFSYIDGITINGNGASDGSDVLSFSAATSDLKLNFAVDQTDSTLINLSESGGTNTASIKSINSIVGSSSASNKFDVGTTTGLSLTGGSDVDEFNIDVASRDSSSAITINSGTESDVINITGVTNATKIITSNTNSITFTLSQDKQYLTISGDLDGTHNDCFIFNLENLGSDNNGDIVNFIHSNSQENPLVSISFEDFATLVNTKITGDLTSDQDLTLTFTQDSTSTYKYTISNVEKKTNG